MADNNLIGVTMNVIGKVINVSPNSNINMADATKRIISQMKDQEILYVYAYNYNWDHGFQLT